MPVLTPVYGLRSAAGTDSPDLVVISANITADVEATLQAQLASPPRGIIARGNRATASSSATTTEIGVLRLDSIPVVSGRAYRIWTSPMQLYSNVAGDVVAARIRVSTSGAATTASTVLGIALTSSAQTSTGTIQPESRAMSEVYVASSTTTLSVLLSLARNTGTGNGQILVGEDLVVEDIGVDPGDTGVDL
jgi:hypothetical protein